MRIHLEGRPLRWLAALGLAVLLTALEALRTDAPAIMRLGMALACGLLALSTVLRFEIRSAWMLPAELLAAGFCGVLLLHIAINGEPLKPAAFVYNLLLSMMLLLAILAVVGRAKLASGIWITVCWLFGLVDAFVYEFRGGQIVLNDFLSIGTALSVADNFEYTVSTQIMVSVVLYAASMVVLARTSFPEWRRLKRLWARALALALAAAMAALPVAHLDRYRPYTWANRGSKVPGVLYEFALELKDLKIDPPEGYCAEAVQAVADEYAGEETGDGRRPHVIAVMVEAWSDLSVRGDLAVSAAVTPWLDAFLPTAIHGGAVSSVYGGSTATSEWEFLTGSTMAFMPAGSMAYRQYVTGDVRSLVDVMKGNGYSCMAMHPYYASGWDRSRVYALMGFDDTLFLEDADWGEAVRKYVSDDAFVEMLIEQFESRREEGPLFLFGITMQNHSGYDVEGFEPTVRVTEPALSGADVEQYLSLMQLTDRALEKLIAYFEDCGEDVVVLAFGDHQPKLSAEFDAALGYPTQLEKHVVPFFIWKSYEDEAREVPLTSVNYLGAMLLEEAGLPLPPYHRFLLEAQRTIPAITGAGVVENGGYTALSALTGEPREVLERYRLLQYANVFDFSVDDEIFTGVSVK